jgi:hypothetical protein
MTDQKLVLDSLKKARLIISEYMKPDRPHDAKRTLDVLILILEDEVLGTAMDRLQAASG